MSQMQTTLKDILPTLRILIVKAKVDVHPSSDALKLSMEEDFKELRQELKTEEISQLEPIKRGREAYRILGKDPTKYRLSAEKLLRRVVKGEGIEAINNLVDLSNYLSISLQAPIGTFDSLAIRGNPILDYGRDGEVYKCLANYELNLKGLLIVRDDKGPFGSTTSDSIRTSVTDATNEMLMAIYLFDSKVNIDEVKDRVYESITQHANARQIEFQLV